MTAGTKGAAGAAMALLALPLTIGLSGCSGTGVAVGAAATLGTAVLQERTTREALSDAEIQVSLNNALFNHSPALFADVSLDVVEGRVLMTGDVPERQDRIEAARIAWSIDGVREVANEIEVGEDSGARAFVEDMMISGRVRARLIGAAEVRSVNYNIETVDGTVYLIGLARSGEELARAADIAARTPGVRRVVSHVLTANDPRRLAARAGPAAG